MSRAAITVNRECGTETAIGGGSGELLGASVIVCECKTQCQPIRKLEQRARDTMLHSHDKHHDELLLHLNPATLYDR